MEGIADGVADNHGSSARGRISGGFAVFCKGSSTALQPLISHKVANSSIGSESQRGSPDVSPQPLGSLLKGSAS